MLWFDVAAHPTFPLQRYSEEFGERFGSPKLGQPLAELLGGEVWTLVAEDWRRVLGGARNASLVEYPGLWVRSSRRVSEAGKTLHADLEPAEEVGRLIEPLTEDSERSLAALLFGEGLPKVWKADRLGERLRLSERQVRRLLGQLEERHLITRARAGRSGMLLSAAALPVKTRRMARNAPRTPSELRGRTPLDMVQSEFGLVAPALSEAIRLNKAELNVVGRESDARVQVSSHLVSRRHAEIHWDDEFFVLTDLGSTNGTLLNGVRVREPSVLVPEDRLTFGDVSLIYTPLRDDGTRQIETRRADWILD